VRHEDDRELALPLHARDQVIERFPSPGVSTAGGRFIKQQQNPVAQQREGDEHALGVVPPEKLVRWDDRAEAQHPICASAGRMIRIELFVRTEKNPMAAFRAARSARNSRTRSK